jgi:oxygen-independent coproporphyrinogen III oxidase
MLNKKAAKCIRSFFAGRNEKFIFQKALDPELTDLIIETTNLYIHIPFCRNSCPYCPYNKVAFDETLANSYFEALQAEIAMYARKLGAIEINSVYFGGGSPAIVPNQVINIIAYLKECFRITGDICIELSPLDCTNENLEILRQGGITLISVGIQSFKDENLQKIGRSYSSVQAIEALKNAARWFKNNNVDLMFALPGQEEADIMQDLEIALQLGATQITVYPLFTFPYTTVGNFQKLKQVKMPSLRKRRRQYFAIYNYLESSGFQRTSVWSFKHNETSRYSSVTRDGYVGFGAGSGSHFETGFYLNTFSVSAYISRIKDNQFSTALRFELNENLNNLFWLYWRFYDTQIPTAEFKNRFHDNHRIKLLMNLFRLFGLVKKESNFYRLTQKGSFWLHLAQNHFSLSYINTIWNKAMREPFPNEITF